MANGAAPGDLAAVREAVVAVRRRKGMVVDPRDPDSRSDGSFFTNPIVDPATLASVLERARDLGIEPDAVPRFSADGGTKLAAAWLIERAGFHKGLRHGNVGLSSRHTLAIVNRGGGTAREVLELVTRIRAGVWRRFGVALQPEPDIPGWHPEPLGDG